MKRSTLAAIAVAIMFPMIAFAEWGPYSYFTPNVSISYSRVDNTNLTWQFKNTSPGCSVEPFTFSYTYIDADSNQLVTSSDVQPLRLAPNQSVGGWTAFSANTRGMLISISPTQYIRCD